MENKVNVSGGIGFIGMLTIAFIVLKLINIISWSWIWVLSPLWVPTAILLLMFVLLLIGGIIMSMFKRKK